MLHTTPTNTLLRIEHTSTVSSKVGFASLSTVLLTVSTPLVGSIEKVLSALGCSLRREGRREGGKKTRGERADKGIKEQ